MRDDTKAKVEHWADATFSRVGIWLYIVTQGRLSRVLAHRRTLLLRTRGRRTGKARTVVLQYFPDGDDMLIVAANAGLPRNPDWYHNLLADPDPSVLVEGRTVHVTPRECPVEERDEFWSHVLSGAPDYEKFLRRTSRLIPFMRLTPTQRAPRDMAAEELMPRHAGQGGSGARADSDPLMDQFLPRYDLDVVHAETFDASPAECYAAALELDLLETPVVRVALGMRGLPRRVRAHFRARRNGTALEESPQTFRLRDMVGLGWILLSETPGVETVLGQVSRPWKAVADPVDPPTTPEQFISFDAPGFAKVVTSLRADPQGSNASILTIKTRVRLTDAESRRRFKRYWLLVGPVSSLIRHTALHQLATQLHEAPRDGAADA